MKLGFLAVLKLIHFALPTFAACFGSNSTSHHVAIMLNARCISGNRLFAAQDFGRLPQRWYIDGMTATIPKYRLFISTNFWSLFGGAFLLFGDLAMGAYLLSIFVCPIWFLVSVIRNRMVRTESRVALFRAAVPALILGIVLANTLIQWKIADVHGEQIVRACESFYSDNGRYPKALDELVPRYLPSIPHAMYCPDREFNYLNYSGVPAPFLRWHKFWTLRKIYSFESKQWYHVD